MRQYLEAFFEEFEYEKEDKEYLLSVYDKICADEFAASCFKEAIGLYDLTIECDYRRIINLAEMAAKKLYLYEYTTELLVFCCLTKKLKERYDEKGISKEIFVTTIKDFRYQMEVCKNVKGIIGTPCSDWCIGFVAMTRFGLGRFQYEVIKFNADYTKDGKTLTPESLVLNVHIPASGQPLSGELALDSFERAKEFYKDIIGEPFAFKCSSWLLYPEHEQMLSHESNIYRFMQMFDIIGNGIKKNNGDLYRIFGTDELRPEFLPENTSLQRAYKKHLLNGGKTGYGVGVRFG